MYLYSWSLRHIALSVIGVLNHSIAWELRQQAKALLLPQTTHASIDFRHCTGFEEGGIETLLDFISEMEEREVTVEITGIARHLFNNFREVRIGYKHLIGRDSVDELCSVLLIGSRDG